MTAAQARERLLNLYPANAIRSAWSLGNVTKEKAIDQLVKTASTRDAQAFAFNYFPLTKQHVYLFLASGRLDPLSIVNPVAGETPVGQRNQNGEAQYFYLVETRFEVMLLDSDPVQREFIEFLWPILVAIRPNLLQVKFTVLEKDVRSYFRSANGRVMVARRGVDEKLVIKMIQDELLRLNRRVAPLDINRGIKALWAGGYIDSQDARFKKTKSTSTETMDERYYIRRDMPEVYAEVRRAPILKAQFEFMREKDQFVPHFIVEANNGLLRFPTYGTRPESTLNVVAKILELN